MSCYQVRTRFDPIYGEHEGGSDIYPDANGHYHLFDEDELRVEVGNCHCDNNPPPPPPSHPTQAYTYTHTYTHACKHTTISSTRTNYEW